VVQNNKFFLRQDATIVQDNARIVQAQGKSALLDDFVIEFGRLFYSI